MSTYKLLITLIIGALLVGCGGSGSGSGSSSDTVKTGVFLDSPVINIGYRTETLEGVTNSLGEYEYLRGETVTFFIGDLELPPVTATGTVTPLDIAATQDTSDSEVVNIIRLLQTLDKNGNLDDGITIADRAIAWATQVDFTLSISDFAASSAVDTLITNGGQDVVVTALVSTDSAISHFEEKLAENNISFDTIVGVWRSSTTNNDFVSVAFFDDGSYVYTVYDSASPSEESGMELGTYTQNSTTAVLDTTQTLDNNEGRGLSGDITLFASVSDNTLTLSFDDNQNSTIDGGESVIFTKVEPSGLVGIWRSFVTSNDFVSVAFFDDGTYVYTVYDSDSPSAESGMELGTYVLNTTTGVLLTVQTLDNNEGRALSEDITHFASVSDNTLTLSFDDNLNNTIDDGESVDFLN